MKSLYIAVGGVKSLASFVWYLVLSLLSDYLGVKTRRHLETMTKKSVQCIPYIVKLEFTWVYRHNT